MEQGYVVIIEPAGDNYSAYVPDLPGCVSAGDTVEETRELIAEAIRMHLARMVERGLDVPAPTSRAYEVRVA